MDSRSGNSRFCTGNPESAEDTHFRLQKNKVTKVSKAQVVKHKAQDEAGRRESRSRDGRTLQPDSETYPVTGSSHETSPPHMAWSSKSKKIRVRTAQQDTG